MTHCKFLVIFLLAGCGEAFTAAGGEALIDAEIDGGGRVVEVDAEGSGGSGAGGAAGTGGASSGGVRGSGGAVGAGGVVSGGSGGAPSAGADAASLGGNEGGAPIECLTDLSGVGTGDFSIHFTLTTTETVLTLALLSQRTGCDETSMFWDISLSPTGGVIAVTNDGMQRVFAVAGDSLNDGEPHRVDVIRRDGMFWYESDGAVHSTQTSNPYSFGTFSPLVLGSSACVGVTPASGRATISDVCLTRP